MLRKLLRFRLRGLLILVTVVAMVTAWYAKAARQHAREQQALDSLDEMASGHIAQLCDDEMLPCGFGLSGTARLKWAGPAGIPTAWRRSDGLAIFYIVDEMYLDGSCFETDEAQAKCVDCLTQFGSLRRLQLRNSRLSADCVDRLAEGLKGTTIVVRYAPR